MLKNDEQSSPTFLLLHTKVFLCSFVRLCLFPGAAAEVRITTLLYLSAGPSRPGALSPSEARSPGLEVTAAPPSPLVPSWAGRVWEGEEGGQTTKRRGWSERDNKSD